jgi:rubrerythrin
MKTEKDFEIMNEIIGYLSFLLTSFDSEELELIRDKVKERVDDVNTGNMLFLKELVNKYFLENALKPNNNSYYMENMLDCNWINDLDHGVIKCRKCVNNICRNDEPIPETCPICGNKLSVNGLMYKASSYNVGVD